jgi:hypothetical protein
MKLQSLLMVPFLALAVACGAGIKNQDLIPKTFPPGATYSEGRIQEHTSRLTNAGKFAYALSHAFAMPITPTPTREQGMKKELKAQAMYLWGIEENCGCQPEEACISTFATITHYGMQEVADRVYGNFDGAASDNELNKFYDAVGYFEGGTGRGEDDSDQYLTNPGLWTHQAVLVARTGKHSRSEEVRISQDSSDAYNQLRQNWYNRWEQTQEIGLEPAEVN